MSSSPSTDSDRSPSELHGDILRLHQRINRCCEILERTAVEPLQHTSAKLRAVTSTTDAAASSLLHGLEEALGLVDALGAKNEVGAVQDRLRDLLFDLIGYLQFQDVTNQQLAYASGILAETEERLASIACALVSDADVHAPASAEHGRLASPVHDPVSGSGDPVQQQALVDQLFGS